MKRLNLLSASCLISLLSMGTSATANYQQTTVEEQRIEKARAKMPEVVDALAPRVVAFSEQVQTARSYTTLMQLVLRHGDLVWQEAVKQYKAEGKYDDRPLYWARLQMTKALRTTKLFASLLPDQQAKVLWQLELLSRGQHDVKFDKNTQKKILITGFDPFFLDRHIDQSNPSGATALALDDVVISNSGTSAEIETLIVPVRFADFDQGMIETLLTPYFADQSVDMIITVSMGREDFDLERFPGLRRSAKAPDNLNALTGANGENPLIPSLNGKPLKGPEFVQFSLPVGQMQLAKGQYEINDNHFVETLSKGEHYPDKLSELADQTAVQGSGGGYLSNEISYRSILLRNAYAPVMPVGHIHTPRISTFDGNANEAIIEQIKGMLGFAITP